MIYDFAPYRLLPDKRQLLRDGVPVRLGGRAFDVLLALVERRDRTVTKNELMDLVWPTVVVEENNLEVQIVNLRKLLGYAAMATVPGRGYRFTLPVVPSGDIGRQDDDQAAARSREQTNLPVDIPVLYGRDEDVRRLQELLKCHQLVTVAGPGGIGKTKLAQAVAKGCAQSYSDGAWWVDLAPITDQSLLSVAVATTLGLHMSGDALDALLASLARRSILIVLDNAEHLLDGVASFVVRLKRELPTVFFLVTSQEPLRVEDEFVFRPEPLSLPTTDDPQSVAASGAVALFVARARAADRRFALSEENRSLVVEICRSLDGIPLAIELAAARVRLLGIEGLRDRLNERFRVLTAGRRVALRRHQTLRAALEWSHHLLSEPEQVVLRRLSVFVGGFTIEAAQQVAEDDHGIDRWDVLEHLGALVEKSLVIAEGEVGPRYRLLETTRLFALERLIESGETDEARRRHRDHYLALAEDCERTLLFGETRQHLARLDIERDNLLSALAWAPRPEDAVPGLRLAAAMHHYWFMRAMPARGAEVTRAALERPGADEPTSERCHALLTAGWLSMWAGALDVALRHLSEALALARSFSDPRLLCLVLTRFAHLQLERHEVEAAHKVATEAVEVGRPQGDVVEVGNALVLLAHVRAVEGDYQSSEQLFREALALRERMNIPSGMVAVHLALGSLSLKQGSRDSAKAHLGAALALLPRAATEYEGLRLIGLTSQWAGATGQLEAALLLEAVVVEQFRRGGFKAEPRESEHLKRAQLTLPIEVVESLTSAGRALSYEQAIERVRALLSENPLKAEN